MVAGLPRQRSRGRHRAVRDVRSGVRIGLYRRGDGATRSGCPMSFGPFSGTYDPLFRGAWLKWAHGLSHAQALDADALVEALPVPAPAGAPAGRPQFWTSSGREARMEAGFAALLTP